MIGQGNGAEGSLRWFAMVEARVSVDGGWVGNEMLLPPRTDGIALRFAVSQEVRAS